MQTSIADRKLHAIELISKLEDENLLTVIEGLLDESGDNGDWGLDISETDKADILEGLEDLKNGKSMPYEDFGESIKNRFR